MADLDGRDGWSPSARRDAGRAGPLAPDRRLRRQPHGRLRPAAERRLPGGARAGAQGARSQYRDRQCRRLRRHRVGRPRSARLVGAGRHRRRHPRARRQRHAPRPRSGRDAARARHDRLTAQGSRHPGSSRRHVCVAQSRAGLRGALRRHLPRSRGQARPHAVSFFPRRGRWRANAEPARRHPSDRAGRRDDRPADGPDRRGLPDACDGGAAVDHDAF